MISCTEFIPAYSEGFKYIENIGGREELERFWSELRERYFTNTLSKLIAEKGLEGCYEYWGTALNEEAADFTMTLDSKEEEFKIALHKCPSKDMLNNLTYMEPHHAYCDHCTALYKPIAEKNGFVYVSEIDCEAASCTITIKKPKA